MEKRIFLIWKQAQGGWGGLESFLMLGYAKFNIFFNIAHLYLIIAFLCVCVNEILPLKWIYTNCMVLNLDLSFRKWLPRRYETREGLLKYSILFFLFTQMGIYLLNGNGDGIKC